MERNHEDKNQRPFLTGVFKKPGEERSRVFSLNTYRSGLLWKVEELGAGEWLELVAGRQVGCSGNWNEAGFTGLLRSGFDSGSDVAPGVMMALAARSLGVELRIGMV